MQPRVYTEIGIEAVVLFKDRKGSSQDVPAKKS